jgi:hypothetical protein
MAYPGTFPKESRILLTRITISFVPFIVTSTMINSPIPRSEIHPHIIKEIEYILVNRAMFSSSIAVPFFRRTLICPSLESRLNLASSENTFLYQLSWVFHCVTLVHHRILARLLFGLMRGFLLVTVQRPDYEYVSRELVVKPLFLACHSTCG